MLSVGVSLAACGAMTPSSRITVTRTPPGDRAMREEGPQLKLRRMDLPRRAGLVTGFTVVHADREWRALWPTLDADRIPLLPGDLDFTREMLIVSSPTRKSALASEVRTVVDTAENGLHVYVVQTVPGDGCPTAPDREALAFDVARVTRVDKDVHFHVETASEAPCQAMSAPKITCRVNGTTDKLEESLHVPPGKSVACVASTPPGLRATFDRTWTWDALPGGAAAKLSVAANGTGVTFTTDVFGTYSVRLEELDDLGRKAATTAKIAVDPPRGPLVLQMAWTKLEPTDDPASLPRVELHVIAEAPPPPASAGKKAAPAAPLVPPRWGAGKAECASGMEKAPAWCSARGVGGTIVMEIAPDSGARARIGVLYTDERVVGQPVVCVRAYRDGARTSDLCDTAPRAAGTWWEAATLDTATGKLPAPPPLVIPASTAPAEGDAGARGAAPDGGGAARPRAMDAGGAPGATKP